MKKIPKLVVSALLLSVMLVGATGASATGGGSCSAPGTVGVPCEYPN